MLFRSINDISYDNKNANIINNNNDYNIENIYGNDSNYLKNTIDRKINDETEKKNDESRIMDLVDMMGMDSKIGKEVEKEVAIPNQGKAHGLYVGYNLLLAAHAIQSTGSGECLEAEV